MTFKLPQHIHDQWVAARGEQDRQKAVFANLNDSDLADSAKFWMQHCVTPKQVEPGQPVYDSTFWHIIVPELLRRLKR
jgi:hypothetical protein